MRGLTLTQPWATLVALGAKKIETRSWATQYRGPLAIHAATGLAPVGGRRGLHYLCGREPFASVLAGGGYSAHLMPAWGLPLGVIVAVARLEMCLTTDPLEYDVTGAFGDRLTEQERAFGDYSPNRWGWLLADVRRLPEPVPARGALGLWAVPLAIQAQIAEALA